MNYNWNWGIFFQLSPDGAHTYGQLLLFGAGWTAGSLKYLCASGAASLTYYETSGWRGVMRTWKSVSFHPGRQMPQPAPIRQHSEASPHT